MPEDDLIDHRIDHDALDEMYAPGADANAIAAVQARDGRLKDHHHLAAMLFARGETRFTVAAEVGVTVSRVEALLERADFKKLIKQYRRKRKPTYAPADAYSKARLLRENALNIINERYEEKPWTITHAEALSDLRATNEMLEDRVTRTIQLHGDLKDMPLAEVVNMRRARSEQLQASTKLLPVGEATEPESGLAVPAPTKQTDES